MKFEVGDLCQVIGCEVPEDPWGVIGQLVVIMMPPQAACMPSMKIDWCMVYPVEFYNWSPPTGVCEEGEFIGFREEHLKKLDDDDDDRHLKTEWDKNIWSPKELVTCIQ